MTRRELLAGIASLSDADLARVAPLIEADLDAIDDLTALPDEIAAGQRRAREDGLLDEAEVAERVAEVLRGPS